MVQLLSYDQCFPQGWQYGTPQFLLKSTIRLYGTRFSNGYGCGTLVRCFNLRSKRAKRTLPIGTVRLMCILRPSMKIRATMLVHSSVARGGGGGGGRGSPLIGMSTKMQNKKNTTFLALLRLFYALEWTK